MDKFIKIITDAEFWAGLFFIVFVAGALSTVGTAILSDKTIQCYYPKTKANYALTEYRVMAKVDWFEDHVAFASHDPEEMQAFYSKVKQCTEE